jgi:hypothetical protein
MRFEIDHLEAYDDESLLNELRRVATLVPGPKLSITQFNVHSKVHASTLQKKFGGWSGALEAAGLKERFDDATIGWTREEILSAMQTTAKKLQKDELTRQEFDAHTGISSGAVRRLFGSWKAALAATALRQSALGKRYTDEQCFENLLAVWTQYGRPPKHREMNLPPSKVSAKAYVRRWGTWRKALSAFVARVNDPLVSTEPATVPAAPKNSKSAIAPDNRNPREIPLALRYFILKRDNFRCVLDGRSPATERGLVLHVDHIKPWAKNGPTVASNLRTLCSHCNLGKGVTLETEI